MVDQMLSLVPSSITVIQPSPIAWNVFYRHVQTVDIRPSPCLSLSFLGLEMRLDKPSGQGLFAAAKSDIAIWVSLPHFLSSLLPVSSLLLVHSLLLLLLHRATHQTWSGSLVSDACPFRLPMMLRPNRTRWRRWMTGWPAPAPLWRGCHSSWRTSGKRWYKWCHYDVIIAAIRYGS